jgi:hypothetical protein
MRSDEFDECNASAKIESNYHSKVAPGDFESRSFTVQNLYIRSSRPHLIHRIPLGSLEQCSPALKRTLRFRMPLGARRKHAPCDNSHGREYVPETGTMQ